MILLVVIFILVMQFLWVYIDELVGKGLSLGIVAEFLFWGSCTVLPLALPLATLLASMMTVGNMGENNELIALKAAGVSVLRVMRPILIASFFISIGTFFVINNLVPVSYNEISPSGTTSERRRKRSRSRPEPSMTESMATSSG